MAPYLAHKTFKTKSLLPALSFEYYVFVMVGHHYARRRRAWDIRRDVERAARATDEAEDTDVASG